MAETSEPTETETQPAEEGAATEGAPAESGATEAVTATSATADASVSAEAGAELTLEEAQGWVSAKLDDMRGATIGKIDSIYVDDQGGRPEWLLARMGRFGHFCLVPARDAVGAGGHVWVPYTRDQVRAAPRMSRGESLQRSQEQALLEHYGIGSAELGRAGELADQGDDQITARPA